MELRSYNVERVYKDCVKCCIGEDLGVNKEQLALHTEDIKDMCSQIAVYNGWTLLATANIRKDGEIWTPYLQIVEMLIRMGKRIGVVDYTGKLIGDTTITIKNSERHLTAVEVLNSKKTFYVKEWQQNGYYPIEKFVYHEDIDCYEQFVQKMSGWYSWGIAYKEPIIQTDGHVINNRSWWLYIFEHNSFKFSFDEMKDNKHYNYE